MGKISLGTTLLANAKYEESIITLHNDSNEQLEIIYFHNGKANNIKVRSDWMLKIQATVMLFSRPSSAYGFGAFDGDKDTGKFIQFSENSDYIMFIPLVDDAYFSVSPAGGGE